MRAAFLGTPAAAIPSLGALAEVASVDLVVTQPDAARGRSGRPVPPPVKVAATEWGLRIVQPTTQDQVLTALDSVAADIAVVVAYGRILAPSVLAAVPMGYVNVHFSLLPRWRGAAPVERSILEGDERTGVTLMVLDEGMDTGPLLGVYETEISPDETGGTLTARLAHAGARLLSDVLPEYARGRVTPAPQMESGATHAARLTTAEAQILPDTSLATAKRMVRAFSPRPGAWALVDGSRIKIWQVSAAEAIVPVGHIETIAGIPTLGLEGGAIRLDVLQPAGSRRLTGTEWSNGRHGAPARVSET
jgi:methionyl-tRNA formyltransferase